MSRAVQRVVLDTNALISRLLVPGSTPAKAVTRALRESELLVSEQTLKELADVLSRRKFDRYVSHEERQTLFRHLSRVAVYIPVFQRITACRDERDNKFLELAVCGQADVIVSGDSDLLDLHPFRGISILCPADYLAL